MVERGTSVIRRFILETFENAKRVGGLKAVFGVAALCVLSPLLLLIYVLKTPVAWWERTSLARRQKRIEAEINAILRTSFPSLSAMAVIEASAYELFWEQGMEHVELRSPDQSVASGSMDEMILLALRRIATAKEAPTGKM